MKVPQPNYVALLGLIQWGDLAGVTIYRNRKHKLVAFAKTFPTSETTPLKTDVQQAFAAAAAAWHTLTDHQRDNWNKAAKTASLPITGYNLFMHYQLSPDPSTVNTIAHQTGIPIP